MRAGQPPLRHRLHRTLGATSGLVLVYLVLTGLPLQFTDSLQLASRHVANPALLDWYGLQAPDSAIRSGALVSIGEWLYLDAIPVAESRPLSGVVPLHNLEIALVGRELLLISKQQPGHIERLPLDTDARRIGLHRDQVVIDTGMQLLQLDEGLLNASPSLLPAADVQWATVEPIEGATLADARRHYRSRMLTTERLLQDLHSGRLFGTPGVWIVNVAALLTIMLAATGLLIWWRTRR